MIQISLINFSLCHSSTEYVIMQAGSQIIIIQVQQLNMTEQLSCSL